MQERRKELNSEEFIVHEREYKEGYEMVRNTIKRQKRKRVVVRIIYCLIFFLAIFGTIGYEISKYSVKDNLCKTEVKINLDSDVYVKIYSYNSFNSTKYYAKLYYSKNNEYKVEIIYNNCTYLVTNDEIFIGANEKNKSLEFDIIYQGEKKHYLID